MFVCLCLWMSVPGVVDLSFARPRFEQLSLTTSGFYNKQKTANSLDQMLRSTFGMFQNLSFTCCYVVFRNLHTGAHCYSCWAPKILHAHWWKFDSGRVPRVSALVNTEWCQWFPRSNLIQTTQTGPLNATSSPSNKRQKWLRDHCVNLVTPSQSPDLM